MKSSKQMSESVRIGIFLSLAGGFMDAYSYICRGKVFANAQTGNIVLLGQSLAEANFHNALKYILPIITFALGVYLCQKIQLAYKNAKRIHWRQIVLAIEILFVVAIGFLSNEYDSPANMMISFVCGIQVIAFSKFHGNTYATTMCTGNLKSATTLLCKYHTTDDKDLRRKSFYYFFIILVFSFGAAIGALMADLIGLASIWLVALLLLVAFLMMFQKEVRDIF
ncbi:YoaK family protein [Peptostreptococcus stomatis]|uniref:YoaK family protein n=1 Tax=Peptostreptococcus stomatis TaxID=341694 RepID=UPI0028E238B0|nr:YoaK family protein [Peptostreptococcus stomatis]